ncbi:MAG: zinc metalloprotease HtpX [Candidatus Bathyarchaeia archaeon]
MNLWKLRLSMLGTLAVIFGVSTLFFAAILDVLGLLNIFTLILFVLPFNLIQWLFAPHLINAMYRVKEVKREDSPKLYGMVEDLASKSGVEKPKLGIANIPIPNAFAYGSPISGNYIAVTQGLLNTLDMEEVEAVVGHEFGHIKHRDVQIMMLVSFLPALFYYIGQMIMYSVYYGGSRQRREGGGEGLAMLIGVLSMVVYFVLTLFIMGLSRLREYYADSHSASIVEDGPRKLSEGLAKIVSKTGRMRVRRQEEAFALNGFKSLFISDPDTAEVDSAQIAYYAPEFSDEALVERLLRKKVTGADRLMEIFSTHPNITKRLRALRELQQEMAA